MMYRYRGTARGLGFWLGLHRQLLKPLLAHLYSQIAPMQPLASALFSGTGDRLLWSANMACVLPREEIHLHTQMMMWHRVTCSQQRQMISKRRSLQPHLPGHNQGKMSCSCRGRFPLQTVGRKRPRLLHHAREACSDCAAVLQYTVQPANLIEVPQGDVPDTAQAQILSATMSRQSSSPLSFQHESQARASGGAATNT